MKAPRGVEARIGWFRTHSPGGVGLCARHTWRSLGGDYGNPPRWGAPHANAVYDKVIASKRFWRGDPPRGAVVVWKYGKYGHVALSLGGGKILTTDPTGKPGRTGVEPITYPEKAWGATRTRRIWTDQYNGVRFPVGEEPTVGYKYNYSGKPSGKQNVTRSYQRLDSSLYVPPSGALLQKVYVNISGPKLRSGALMGAVRLRCTRVKGTDHTGYIDIPVHPDLIPKNGGILTTHVVFHNNPGAVYWSFKAIGGLESAVISTRYVSRLVVLK